MEEFDLTGPCAITRGSPWRLSFTRLLSTSPRAPVDLTGMTARLEIYIVQPNNRTPRLKVFSEGKIVLGGADGTVNIRLSAYDTRALEAATSRYKAVCRYRLVFTDSHREEATLLRGRIAVLEPWQ